MGLLPFQQGEPLADAFLWLGPIAAIVLVVAVMMWFLAWLARYVEYLKTLESRWLDPSTLDFVRRVLEGVWIALMALIVLAIASTRSETVLGILVAFLLRVPALFSVVFILFAAALLVRTLHRFAAYLRGELKTKPRRVAPPQALAFTEIVLKYIIYIGALSLAVLGGVRALPAEDQESIAMNIGTLPAPDRAVALGILVAILVVLVLDRFVNSIFEDMKGRTKKFSARVLEEFKAIARYAVWMISAIIVLFVVLGLILTQEQLVIFAIGFVAFLLIMAILAFDPVRNALAGVSLMRADPFDVGDRVKIGDDLVCDVVAMGLSMTQVRTLRGERVTIPNTRLLETPVMNFSRSKPYAVSVDLAVAFDVDHEKVADLLVRAARETRGILSEPPPHAYGKEFEDDTITYQLLAYTDEPERMKDIRSSLIYGLQDLLREAEIMPRAREPERASERAASVRPPFGG